jgi:naphthoate synthase
MNPHTLTPWQDTTHAEGFACETRGGITRIRLTSQQANHGLLSTTARALCDTLKRLDLDRQTKVVMLAAPDFSAFSIGDAAHQEDPHNHHGAAHVQRVLLNLKTPTVASVAGFVLGGGLGIQLACDLTVAADNALFGLTPAHGGKWDPKLAEFMTQELDRAVGHKRAREMQLLCRQYGASEALEMGLVNAVVARAHLERESLRWCREILAHQWRGRKTPSPTPPMEAHG